MANPNFLAPKINKIIESDPQIIKVNMEYTEWGARKSMVDRNTTNSMTISHVPSAAKGN